MYLSQVLRPYLSRVLGIHVYRYGLTHGTALPHDLNRMGRSPRVVFDVGANAGQSALEYAIAWPNATIYSFEPVASTFERLVRQTRRFRNVTCLQLALGEAEGTAEIALFPFSELNSLVPDWAGSATGHEKVRIDTLDGICSREHILRIDLLKIDVEGYDLHVLRGGRGLLARGDVGAVLTEVGFATSGREHVPLEAVRAYLEPLGYVFAGLYEQVVSPETHQLERANALFLPAASARSAQTLSGAERVRPHAS